jgi:hypothetical protein
MLASAKLAAVVLTEVNPATTRAGGPFRYIGAVADVLVSGLREH